MHLDLSVALLSSVLILGGCTAKPSHPSAGSQPAAVVASPISAAPATASASEVKPKLDACALLTTKEIESVQGESVRETKLTGRSAGGFSMSQCFFTLPTFTNSVSLMVVQKGEGTDSREPREFWRDTFHEASREKGREKDNDRDRKHERDEQRGEDDEEGAPPQRVRGVGDEAYWTGSRMGGALYVLKGDSYLRVSIGSPADQATIIKRSKALAQKAIARL